MSFVFSIDRHTSLFGYYSRFNGGLFSIISYILLYYAFVSNMSIRQTLFAIRYMLFSAALVAIYGILEHFGIDEKYWVQAVRLRVFSTLGQPNWLAEYLVALSPLTWGFALLNDKFQMTNDKFKFKIKNSICYLLFAIYYLCLLYTKSRSGILAFGAAYAIFWGLLFLKLLLTQNFALAKNCAKKFLIFTSVILALTFLGRSALPALAETQEKLLITPSSDIRKIVWQGAINVWRHYPFLGTGPETFAQSYYWYRPREHNDTSEWDFLYNKAHNEYLNYLTTTGILGLGSYLLIIAVFVFWSLKKLKTKSEKLKTTTKNSKLLALNCSFTICTLRFALLAGFIGLLVSRFFGFSTVTTNIFFFLFPAIAFVIIDKTVLEEKFVKKSKLSIVNYLQLVIILSTICYLLFAICCLWYADFLFAKGKKYIQANAPLEASDYFQAAIDFNHSEPLFHSELSNAASVLAFSLYSQNEATTAAQMADFAVQESDIALEISPYHLNLLKTRTKMLYNLAQTDEKYYQDALETLLRASGLAPTDAKVSYNLGILYYHLGQKNEAIKTMEKTVELKPNYEEAKKKLEEWQEEN